MAARAASTPVAGPHGGPIPLRTECDDPPRPFRKRYRNTPRSRGTLAFLGEGQEQVLPGAQSVLVEFPALSPLEAPDAPDPSQRQEGTVDEVRAAAVAMRDALYAVISSNG